MIKTGLVLDWFQDSDSWFTMLQVIAYKCLELLVVWKLRKCAKCCESMRNVVNVEKVWESVLNVEKVWESVCEY